MKIKKIFICLAVAIFFTSLLTVSASAMDIYIQMWTGEIITLDVEPNESILALKEKIEEVKGIPTNEQTLVFAGKRLEDGNTFSDYNIQKYSTIHLYQKTMPNPEGTGIRGFNVNLGGDIALNFYVQIGEDVFFEDVILKVKFLGEEKNLPLTMKDGEYYVFTLEGIPPQCLGDQIDAVLYYGDIKVDERLHYTVEENLLALREEYKDDEALVTLVNDILAYGKASEAYTGHSSLVGDYEVAIKEIPAYRPNLEDSSSKVSVQSVNVSFGRTTYLMFTFTFDNDTTPFDLAETVTIDNIIATTYMVGDTCVAISAPISPENFHKDVEVNYNDELILMFSVNDYCDIVTDEGSDATESMKTLVQALYNYGLSAHIVKGEHLGGNGTDTCAHGKVCDVCGEYYGNPLAHDYTYGIDDDANTITATCEGGCNTSSTVTLKAPVNPVYNGERWDATVEGLTNGLVYTLSYQDDIEPINAGTYTAILLLGDKQVSVEFSIAKATPEYTIPIGLTATYGQTLADVTLPLYWTWADATTSVGNVGTSTFNAIFTPADLNNYITIETDITITVGKATPKLTAPSVNNLTYNEKSQTLITSGKTDGGTLMYKVNDGNWTTELPVETNAGTYTVYYKVVGGNNYNDVAQSSLTVVIAKANPKYTVPTGLIGYYGKTLASIELASDWVWMNENVLLGEFGTYTFKARYIPKDGKNYNTVENINVTVTIKHEKHTPLPDSYLCMCGENAVGFIDGTFGDNTWIEDYYLLEMVNTIKNYVDNGVSTIIVTGEKPAISIRGAWTNTAIGASIEIISQDSAYNGKIDLILLDVTEIVDLEFYGGYALNSITLPKVTKIGELSFFECTYLTKLTFGSVVTSVVQFVEHPFFEVGQNVGGCDLVLNCGQLNVEDALKPNLDNKIWYKGIWEEEVTWKSITLTHSGECNECKSK